MCLISNSFPCILFRKIATFTRPALDSLVFSMHHEGGKLTLAKKWTTNSCHWGVSCWQKEPARRHRMVLIYFPICETNKGIISYFQYF